MFRMVIKSDPSKLSQNKLSAEKFDTLLRAICLDTNFKELSPGHYYLEEKDDELGRMFVLEAKFRKLGYIIPNLSEWITYSDVEGKVDELM